MFGSKLTPEEKAAKEARKARERAERRAAQVRQERIREEARQSRFSAMPEFVVRETREVTVKAGDMKDAIALASAAFSHGQEDNYRLDRWDRPSHIEGDTIDAIRTVNIKATEVDD